MEWISVKDRLPDRGTINIVFRGCDVDYAFYEDGFEFPYTMIGYENDRTGEKYKDVTYWMPVPDPPNDK